MLPFREYCFQEWIYVFCSNVQMLVEKPLWKMLAINTLSCGLEACLSVGTVYIPPRLLQAGVEEHYMTLMLALSPVLGLIILPMIGSASDSWCGRFGRRRPFLWMASLGVLLGMQIIPHTWSLVALICPQRPLWLDAALLIGAVCLLEICGEAGMTVMMALLSDLFPEEAESRRAFSVNSMMTSLGGCIGFLAPIADWSQTPIAKQLGGQEALVFFLLTLFFLGCLLTTTCIPEKASSRVEGEKNTVNSKLLKKWKSSSCTRSVGPYKGVLVALCRCASTGTTSLTHVFQKCAHVPPVIWRLFVSEVFSWMTLLTVMLFFSDYMGKGLYEGVANAEPLSQEKRHYNEGVRMASLGLLLQCVVSVLCSMKMDSWVALLGAKVVYISGVALLVLATAVMCITDRVVTVTAMMALTGYSLSVCQVLPRILLCLYHSDKTVFFASSRPRPPRLSKSDVLFARSGGLAILDTESQIEGRTLTGLEPFVESDVCLLVNRGDKSDEDPVRGMCFDMAILDGSYMLAQVLPALFLGLIVELAHSVTAYMAAACCFSLLAFLCSTRVVYSGDDLQR